MTETTLPTAQPNAADAADDAELRAAVHGALRGIAKAWRAHLLYEGQSPALDRIVEQLRETLRDTFTRVPFFTVAVEERELHWNGLVVYQGDDASVDRSGNAREGGFRENLAFALYRDGLREVGFHKGFEREELDAFLGVLARVSRVRDEQDDLLTLLWDRDWYHLRYRYVRGSPRERCSPRPVASCRSRPASSSPRSRRSCATRR